MTTIEVQLNPDQLDQLRQHATTTGAGVDELIRRSIEEYLQRSTTVHRTIEYLLEKNAELYRRLA